jgi:hypothetical protein
MCHTTISLVRLVGFIRQWATGSVSRRYRRNFGPIRAAKHSGQNPYGFPAHSGQFYHPNSLVRGSAFDIETNRWTCIIP